MRRILYIFLLVAFVAVPCVAQRDSDTRRDRREYRHHRPRYYVGNDDVYFDGRVIEGASASSFSILRDGYAKDTWTVYYCGVKIDGASANSFKVLGYGYAKDTWNVYFDGKKVDGASADSFKCGRNGYAHDNWNTYYYGVKIGR